jgi:hypothetical protein
VGIKLVQTRRLHESPTGTKLIFHLRKPETSVPDELKSFIVEAYNQAAAGLIKLLETDLNGQPTNGNIALTPGG